MDLIAMAIPVFLLCIAAEVVVAARRGARVYRLADSLNDLSCGILNQVVAVFTGGALAAIYTAAYHFRIYELPRGHWGTWVFALVAVDLTYYAFHRASHEVNLLWTSHVVHHQSEEYNLSVAVRQDAVEPLFSVWFRLPLAILGLDPLTWASAVAINTIYQFFVHTRLLKKLGPIEWIFVTPSHHRVHHGRDPKYLDRNYSGMFIVWDRLFGSFQVEEEEPAYGITKPLASWNPILAHLQHPIRVMQQAEGLGRWDRVAIWWRAPGWGWPPPPEVVERVTFDPQVPRPVSAYAAVQFAGALPALVVLLFVPSLPMAMKLALSGFIVWTLLDVGALLEGRGWALRSERARLGLSATGAAALGATAFSPAAGAAAVAVAAACGLWLSRLRLG